MQLAITSAGGGGGGTAVLNERAQMLGVGVGVEFEEEADENPVPAFMLSAEPRLVQIPMAGLRLSVPLLLLS